MEERITRGKAIRLKCLDCCCGNSAEVRAEALAADIPAQYPIPENKRIQKYKARYAA